MEGSYNYNNSAKWITGSKTIIYMFASTVLELHAYRRQAFQKLVSNRYSMRSYGGNKECRQELATLKRT